jgi:hypothetical protein
LVNLVTPSFQNYGVGLNMNITCGSPYEIKIGFVPKQIGIFSLDMYTLDSHVTDCISNRLPNVFSTIEYKFYLGDCNKDVYLSIPAASRGENEKGYTENLIDAKKVFVFWVIN